ncbi:O-antigen ligase family protein [Bremerella sp. T1]|uniref:O-antigen ligase family protein n=1 Tax=Bremerella sp. TYQ1 TaxID=3119568 RepID=UPI001CCBB390|nr:O-antigen ligase family protein [Bremerella volcania]UBM35411.1 O-antigen ligase family protein [Bremerella volcania]
MQATELHLDRNTEVATQRPAAIANAASLPWCFLGLCLYLISQAYLIPLWPQGPSWAVWPRVADFAGGLMAAACLWHWQSVQRLPAPLAKIMVWLMAFLWLIAISFLAQTLLSPKLYWNSPDAHVGVQWGLYQLARMIQFAILFFCAASTPLTEPRRRWLVAISTCVLWFVVITVALTYTGTIPYESVVAHLPESQDVSGPWASFGESYDGLGLISYNHAYTACQLVLLFSLHLSLTYSRFSASNVLLLFAVTLAVFLSGSRAGFGAMLVLVLPIVWSWIRSGGLMPLVWTGTVGLTIVAAMLIAPSMGKVDGLNDFKEQVEELVVRQSTTFAAYKSDNLAGRTDIWKMHLEALDDRPWTWLVGYGFGTAITQGNQAHMQPLNMISEIGLIGLAVGLVLLCVILHALWKCEPSQHPLLWGTIALLLTSMTQETFYPVAAFGHFLGFYLFALAIAMRLWFDVPSTTSNDLPHHEVPQLNPPSVS